jgi:hypothetical protein
MTNLAEMEKQAKVLQGGALYGSLLRLHTSCKEMPAVK